MQILFDLASNLTGGLITDITTMLLAIVFLTVLYLGVEILVVYLTGFSFSEAKEYIDYSNKRERRERIRNRYEQTHSSPEPVSTPKLKNDHRISGLGI